MTPRNFISLIVIFALSALFGCGRGGDDDGGAPPVQPTRADVFIAFDPPVANLAGLDFKLNNTAGATFDNSTQPIAAINAAQGSLSLALANFDVATNSNRILLINGAAAGINTGTSPIIRITYAISAGFGTPTFSIASQGTFTAIAPDNSPVTPAVTAANLVVSVTYAAE